MPHATNRQSYNETAGEMKIGEAATRADVCQRMTDQITASVEAGAGEWEMPWRRTDGVGIMRPINVATKKPYRGAKPLALWIAAQNNRGDP